MKIIKKMVKHLRGIYGPQPIVITKKEARIIRKLKQKYSYSFFLTMKVVKHPQVVKDLSNKFSGDHSSTYFNIQQNDRE